jgi:hypothetical protein
MSKTYRHTTPTPKLPHAILSCNLQTIANQHKVHLGTYPIAKFKTNVRNQIRE